LPIDRSQLVKIIAGNEVDIHAHPSEQDSSQRTPGRLRKKLASTRRRDRRRQGGPR
jgi:hypothetical protein